MTECYTKNLECTLNAEPDETMLDVIPNFRPLSEGLTDLKRRAKCPVNLDNEEKMTAYVYKQLLDLPYKRITKSTVSGWFTGKHEPRNREHMIALCFALKLDKELVTRLFRDVYYDRELDCRIPKEAIYLYCLEKDLSYKKATELIKKLPPDLADPDVNHELPDDIMYTRVIEDEIRNINSDEELLRYFEKKKDIFFYRNCSSRQTLETLLSDVQGQEGDSDIVKQAVEEFLGKRKVDVNAPRGLVVKEALQGMLDSVMERKMAYEDTLKGKDVESVEFMLWQILGTSLQDKDLSHTFGKNPNLPLHIKRNFPSKNNFLDILNGGRFSYDATRKAIILLGSYKFWREPCNSKLKTKEEKSFSIVYRDQMNDMLSECCLHTMNVKNPFDWIFLYSTRQADKSGDLQDALKTFRWFVTDFALGGDE